MPALRAGKLGLELETNPAYLGGPHRHEDVALEHLKETQVFPVVTSAFFGELASYPSHGFPPLFGSPLALCEDKINGAQIQEKDRQD